MNNNIHIKFNSYKAQAKQLKKVENKLDYLLRQIPCDSRVSLDFEYKDKVFHGKLKVNTSGKQFFSEDEAILLDILTLSLCKKAQKQIMKWKKSRTLEEITGIIPLSNIDQTEEDWPAYNSAA